MAENDLQQVSTTTDPNEDLALLSAQRAARRLYPNNQESYDELWPVLWAEALEHSKRIEVERAALKRERPGRSYGV